MFGGCEAGGRVAVGLVTTRSLAEGHFSVLRVDFLFKTNLDYELGGQKVGTFDGKKSSKISR